MIRKLVRRLIRLAILAGVVAGFYFFGRAYLWPPEDRSTIKVVGMIEAPEVNITSRIAGRIKQLDLLEGDHVKKGQVVALIEDIDLKNQLAKSQGRSRPCASQPGAGAARPRARRGAGQGQRDRDQDAR